MKQYLALLGLLPAVAFGLTDRTVREAVGDGNLQSWTTEEQGVFSFGFADSRYNQKALTQTLRKLCQNSEAQHYVDGKMIMASYFPNDEPLAVMIVERLSCRQLAKTGRVTIRYHRY